MASALTTMLIVAGACYSSTGVFEKCALQPSECASGSRYRTSRWLALSDQTAYQQCSSPEQVRALKSMGRCNAASERYQCTSDATACRLSQSFVPNDGFCDLVRDVHPSNSFSSAHYGYCDSDDHAQYEPFCAWKATECSSITNAATNATIYTWHEADPLHTASDPDKACKCDQVKTGACVFAASAAAASRTDSYCAVSESVCKADSSDDNSGQYHYLTALQVEQQLNRTCRLCDTLPPPPTSHVIQAGACVATINNAMRRCALQPADCDDPAEFVSSWTIRQGTSSTGAAIPSQAQNCLTQSGVQDLRAGRCTADADRGICTSDATACRFTGGFQPRAADCNLVWDSNRNSPFTTTHYGHCTPAADSATSSSSSSTSSGVTTESYCAWKAADCNSIKDPDSTTTTRLTFQTADTTFANTLPECRCDDVRTGACLQESDATKFYCAVDKSACGANFQFVPVRDLETLYNQQCYLCEPLPDVVPAPARSPSAAATATDDSTDDDDVVAQNGASTATKPATDDSTDDDDVAAQNGASTTTKPATDDSTDDDDVAAHNGASTTTKATTDDSTDDDDAHKTATTKVTDDSTDDDDAHKTATTKATDDSTDDDDAHKTATKATDDSTDDDDAHKTATKTDDSHDEDYSTSQQYEKNNLSNDALAGIVIGTVSAVVAFFIVTSIVMRQQRRAKTERQQQQAAAVAKDGIVKEVRLDEEADEDKDQTLDESTEEVVVTALKEDGDDEFVNDMEGQHRNLHWNGDDTSDSDFVAQKDKDLI